MEKDDKTIKYITGGLDVCPSLGQVRSGDDIVRLGPINMMVLTALIENNGEVVSRSALFDQVWPNQSVSDDTLTRCISDLRNRLSGLTDQHKIIETLPKRGYRWIPDVTAEHPADPRQLQPSEYNIANWAVAVVLLVITLGGLFVWLNSYKATSEYIAIALLPIQADGNVPDYLAPEIENQLRACSLATARIRFLSPEVINNSPRNPYPYLLGQLNVQWAVEGSIYRHPDGYKVSLSLVDTNTTVIFHTRNIFVAETSENKNSVCAQFLSELSAIMTPVQKT